MGRRPEKKAVHRVRCGMSIEAYVIGNLHPASGAMWHFQIGLIRSASLAFSTRTEHCTPVGVRHGKFASLYTSHPCRGAVSRTISLAVLSSRFSGVQLPRAQARAQGAPGSAACIPAPFRGLSAGARPAILLFSCAV